MVNKLTPKYLEKKKVPKVLIAGLVFASVLGWTGWKNLDQIKNYYDLKTIFPTQTKAVEVVDGDTFVMSNGLSIRLIGIDAPNRGQPNYETSRQFLTSLLAPRNPDEERSSLINQKPLTLEYDGYQDDKYGRVIAYVWISCVENIVEFCHGEKALVNEIMVKKGFAKKMVYSQRKKLKYDDLLTVPPTNIPTSTNFPN